MPSKVDVNVKNMTVSNDEGGTHTHKQKATTPICPQAPEERVVSVPGKLRACRNPRTDVPSLAPADHWKVLQVRAGLAAYPDCRSDSTKRRWRQIGYPAAIDITRFRSRRRRAG